MEVTVKDTCGSWSRQHLLRVASGGGLGVSHCPAMRLSHRAGSPGTSPHQPLLQRTFEKSSSSPPNPKALSGLSCGTKTLWAAPRSLAWAWVSAIYMTSHHRWPGTHREGASWPLRHCQDSRGSFSQGPSTQQAN